MLKSLVLPITLLALSASALADEGQWQPHQLPQLKAELRRVGITIPAEKFADLSRHPMSAMVSLGGCSAAFVSASGLIVTNHHCAYPAVQRNSSPEHNYISDGFLAKTTAAELPAGPSSLVYVTDSLENVTARVLAGVQPSMSGRARHAHIEQQIKRLIAECEQDPAYRCSVPSFHRGLEYYRIRQMMIRDVRLVYAPSDQIGNFGGDVDNFEWPRHTGDFAFLRAYVGKDGRPAAPAPGNVPYRSKDFLTISARGIKNGDAILLAGYPGRTSRYKLPVEIRHARDISYPAKVAELQADLAVIASASKGNASAEVRYASVVKGLHNGLKKTEGLLAGFARTDIAAIKDVQDQQFRRWLSQTKQTATHAMLNELDSVIASDMALAQEEFAFGVATNSDLLKSARSLYRLALEKQKPDAERETGYQQRDRSFIQARLSRLEQSFMSSVDQARFSAGMQRYRQLPASTQVAGLAPLLPDNVAALYRQTQLGDTAQRLAWMEKDAAAFEQSDDAFIRLAVKLHATGMALENRRKEVDGNLERVVPQSMQALIHWKESQGKPVYPDANSTLRVSYGTVAPYSPRDGLSKGPFTTVEGIAAKHTGATPFNAPQKLLAAVKEQRYGVFKDATLGTVPVNFLSSADTTGGNSGSAVLNKNGELIGLNFDSTYESITKDWYFDQAITRAIHVDIRYLLWVMQEIDGADNLLKEMTIKYPKK